MDTKAFCESLSRRFPEVAPLLAQHIADYDQILPHVFMGDVTRYILSAAVESRKAIVMELERHFEDDSEEIQDLIAVSFVENLEDETHLKEALSGIHADALREEWVRQHTH
jgi:hypothetical protein